MEGHTPSGPLSERTHILLAFTIVALVVMLILAAIYISPKISSEASIAEVSTKPYGERYRAGTYLDYVASGTYNNTTIDGSYHLHMVLWPDGRLAKYGWLNSSVPELNQMMNGPNGDGPYPDAGPSPELDFTDVDVYGMGVGNISTPYGNKVVIQQVSIHEGWVVVYHTGWDPCVVYGCTAIGPNFRLELRLNITNDQLAIEKNASPIKLVTPEKVVGHSAHFYGDHNMAFDYYAINGATLHYNLTATDADMYAYSEADILSMIEGSPYAYSANLTKFHLGNEAGVEELAPGHFFVLLVGHQAENTTISYISTLEHL